MRADIFIPTSNRIAPLTACLESMSAQSLKDFQIILVGLSKNEGVEKLIRKFNDLSINYVIQKDKGLVSAANLALTYSKNDIFVRIDDDVIIDRGWFSALIDTYDSDNKIGGVTGPTIVSDEGMKSRDLTSFLEKFTKSRNPFLRLLSYLYVGVLYENKMYDVSSFLKSGVFTLGSNFKSCLNIKGLVEVNNLEACNWSCRTELLKKIGGFDSIYVKGLGDYHEADAALKIKNLGYKLIFNPKASLKHNVEGGKVESSRPNSYYRIQNFIIFYFRFFKIKSPEQFFKFTLNLTLQNCYYVWKFFRTLNLSNLGAIPGTFVGLLKVLFVKGVYEN